MKTSLVTTVLNDRAGCEAFFQEMEAQTSLPDEIVIVDGGSRDGTWEYLQNYQPNGNYSLIFSQDMGCNVARGRNLAIQAATGELIVSTDVGCHWDKEWFAELIQPMLDDAKLEVVIGSWAVNPENLESDWARTEYVFRGGMKLEATPNSLGISRSIAYKKSVWQKIQGYPEDLTLAADDVVYNHQLKQFQFKSAASPKIRCYWLRHKKLKQFCKEEHRNFFGAGEAAIWQKHFILVNGRIVLELIALIAGLLLLTTNHDSPLALAFLSVFILSITQRLLRLQNAATQLKQMQVKNPWLKLMIFEYTTKIYGGLGYIKGFIRGMSHCQHCRQRLKLS